uniref:anoctamin-1-like n=1 Tax=Callospermophilus lateralis TaxID=76772 RepID=UPI004038BFAD
MRVNEKYSTLPAEDRSVHIINICAIEDIGYLPSEGTLLNSLSVDPDAGCRFGQYFRDGRRKVDYILVYHHKRPVGARGLARRAPASDTALGARRVKQDHPLPGKGAPVDAAPEPPMDYQEDDKRFRRDEYEGHLLEAGLELERDEDTKIHGVGFVKIHAPWSVLCREAEFLKLKMPTKKMYHMSETRGLLKTISSVLQKITDPIQPRVAEHRPQTMKRLSYPFSREKQHLFDLSDKDSFFDSKTRSSIVYEILKRTTCTKAKYSMGITSLLANGVYSAAYPLHDGDYEGDNVQLNDRKTHAGSPKGTLAVHNGTICSSSKPETRVSTPKRQLNELWNPYQGGHQALESGRGQLPGPAGGLRKWSGLSVHLHTHTPPNTTSSCIPELPAELAAGTRKWQRRDKEQEPEGQPRSLRAKPDPGPGPWALGGCPPGAAGDLSAPLVNEGACPCGSQDQTQPLKSVSPALATESTRRLIQDQKDQGWCEGRA